MSTEQLSNIEGLDVQIGLTNCMDDENLFVEVLKMFAMQVDQDKATLEQQFNNDQWQEFGKTCHSIKGASASIGAVNIQESAALLERAGKEDNATVITEVFPVFMQQLQSMKEQLDSLLS
ncbi:Hpt domain-containing protein [Psychrosphaera ytuae]|uniref:Hpt domain-containing protein n=1 Tax=Psychrosphaera ytuae TaxID=2820710 RepID=A0A975HL13_9GAMM|nr:Hpt domain-containing protein [Psychrosphaera ytuae]QTH64874.1 Hpt domain-containing protein [Psychrosphaera ytuae]